MPRKGGAGLDAVTRMPLHGMPLHGDIRVESVPCCGALGGTAHLHTICEMPEVCGCGYCEKIHII